MKNKEKFYGFLSLLSLLYFVTGDIFYLASTGFLVLFTSHKKSDERLRKNFALATRNAFGYVLIIGGMAFGYASSFKDNPLFPSAFILLYLGSIFVYLISYYYYNFKEEKL